MFNKLVNELKQNKYTTIVFFIFLFLFLIGWLIFGLVMPKNGEPVYGNRLDGIEEVKVTNDEKDKLVTELEKRKYVNKASVHVNGKIINVLVETTNGTKVGTAKTLKKVVLEGFSKDQLSFYDIQLFLTNEISTAKGYPAIGYKNSNDNNFTF